MNNGQKLLLLNVPIGALLWFGTKHGIQDHFALWLTCMLAICLGALEVILIQGGRK